MYGDFPQNKRGKGAPRVGPSIKTARSLFKRTGPPTVSKAILWTKQQEEMLLAIFSTMQRASVPLLACLLALPTLAAEPGGLVTGSFGDQPLELTVAPELSGVTIIGSYVDASFFAALMEGEQGPVNLELTISGELPAPAEVALTITFARDMGRSWSGDQDSLALTLDEFAPDAGIVVLSGTLTGQVSGGPASGSRAVTYSFDARLEELD